jgi:hypothetical protein
MLGDRALPVFTVAAGLAVIGLAVALILGWFYDHSLRRFFFAYLAAYAFFLSIVLGAMFMVLMQFLTRAAWSVSVRRIAENITGLMPVMALLAIPLIATVAIQKGTVYRWALPESAATPQAIEAAKHGESEEVPAAVATPSSESVQNKNVSPAKGPELDAVTLQKRPWMNPMFWIIRVVIYFLVWSLIALYFRRLSILQDETHDPELTRRRQIWSGICVVIFGLTLTGAAGDLIMSLDPHWFSTIFGIYFFAGGALASWATLIVITRFLQRAGFLTRSVTAEHYHDLGKYLFGFTFLWGYIAFSQYMLLWYANIPEEIQWFSRHGATTDRAHISGWSVVIVAILFGQLLIPFAGLLSRHVKRVAFVLVFWAVWQLFFHLLDTYWIVMPEYPGKYNLLTFAASVCAYVGIGGVLLAVLVRGLVGQNLRPVADPRLPESLAFHNT